MTYNAESFWVTPIVIRHPMLLHDKTLVEPSLVGPTIIHTHHSTDVFGMFAAHIINKRPGLRNIKFLGSDRQLEIYKGFKTQIPDLQLMVCGKHLEDNVESHLVKKSVSKANRENILGDIFIDLAEAGDEDAFNSHLLAVRSK